MPDNINMDKNKIMYINDFIFRQNLEFYPNLQGLSVEENILKYNESPENRIEEVLTFDLRTLPGDTWNATPKEFIKIVKTNKKCKSLYNFINLLNKYAFNTFIRPENTSEGDEQ